MEKEELLETNEASPTTVEKQEGGAFTLNDEHGGEKSEEVETGDIGRDARDFDVERDNVLDKMSSEVVETRGVDDFSVQNEDQQHAESKESKTQNIGGFKFDNGQQEDISEKINEGADLKCNAHEEIKDKVTDKFELPQRMDESQDSKCGPQRDSFEISAVPGDLVRERNSMKSEIQLNIVGEEYACDEGDSEFKSQEVNLDNNAGQNGLGEEKEDSKSMESAQINRKTHDTPNEANNLEPVFDGTENSGMEVSRSTSSHTLDANPETPRVVERAVALKNFVREKSLRAVSTVLRRLSGKSDGVVGNSDAEGKDVSHLLSKDGELKEVFVKTVDKTNSKPVNYITSSSDIDAENKTDKRVDLMIEGPPQPIAMKGRIILYTRLGCQESKEIRKYFYMKRLRYVEINIDVYPSRKMELEKNTGSTSVPKVFFNDMLIGGLSELKTLIESGNLDEKIEFLITEAPSFEAPLPPLSGEDDMSSSGAVDEMALIVRKMKESIVAKDRFSKMRRFTNCFLGSEAVDFLSEDQYLERTEAVEFARKLASKLFFQHVLDENLFEDGNHLYRFLDDDPIVASQCQNIPRGIITVKPKPGTEIASRLRLLSNAMFEAYASEDGHHVDYRSIHGSEEFARYLRIVQELQRVEIWDFPREEKLAFFINLYNMMTIHAILIWGHPAGAIERRKLFGDFKYVIGGTTYSLSAIQNGILRGNQRPPYTLLKPFGARAKDKRSKVALPYPEPLIHFALVCGTRSGPPLQCYSPGEIDKELLDAARNFLRSGGVFVDFTAKIAYTSKILKWFSVDFGKSEVEVMKHVSNYLDPAESELLLDLLATSELKVIYQPYDWGLNC